MRLCPALALALLTILPASHCLSALPAKTQGAPSRLNAFASVRRNAISKGFKAVALYLNDSGDPFGARFVHQRTGFTLDLLDIQSVPQAFTCTITYPASDKGEPHTQEHLLVGKGNVGRGLAESEQMSLTQSSAYTMQWRTCYMFNTPAGAAVFFEQFRRQLDALLHPDYTDEEIRREVRNFGISINLKKNQLSLEEKGTVYNEMVSSSDRAIDRLFRQIQLDDYGPRHPLAYNSGGEPSGIRELVPADIRKFHDEHYFLGNMSSIVALPGGQTVAQELAAFDRILVELQPQPSHLPVLRESDLPPPQPAPAGSIQVVDFPVEDAQQPGYIALAWPANRHLGERDLLLMQLFLSSFAGDTSTDLYRLFINSKTRKMDVGASGVSAYVDDQSTGIPADIFFDHVTAANLNPSRVTEVRKLVADELNRIASLPDGSPELAQFNSLVQNRLVELRRQLSKLLNSPPEFGSRNVPSIWIDHLNNLNRTPAFRKSVTLQPDLNAVASMLATRKNIWRDLLAQWHLSDTVPYGVVSRPSPALLQQELQQREERIAQETKSLEVRYGVADAQAALRHYQSEYDAESAKLEVLAKSARESFLESPPLTLDDQLIYKVSTARETIPLVSSIFQTMTSATTGIAFRLNGLGLDSPGQDIPGQDALSDDLVYLSLLPNLFTQVGVIGRTGPIPYEEMQERLRKEILGMDGRFSTDVRTGRVELVITGSGNDLEESKRALDWMRLALFHPDWRPQNLPRIRDMVSQSSAQLRTVWEGPEETWVRNPMLSYYRQDSALFLSTFSFFTRAYNAGRLSWMLKDCDTMEHRRAAGEFLEQLSHAAANASRPDLEGLVSALQTDPAAARSAAISPALMQYKKQYDALPGPARKIASDAAADLGYYLPNLPDGSLSQDWAELLLQMRSDLAITPERTLQNLQQLRKRILSPANTRIWMVGSAPTQTQLAQPLKVLLSGLEPSPATGSRNAARDPLTPVRRIDQRLSAHEKNVTSPHFVALFDPNLNGGVIGTFLPFAQYDDLRRDELLNLLALEVFAGPGAHSVFSKTIEAGLAYSNGIGGSLYDGYALYYAERTPQIPQTLHFAIQVVKQGSRDPGLLDYALAGAFSGSYAARSYEDRAEFIAGSLADRVTPAQVRTFRKALLAVRKDPKTAGEVMARIDQVYPPLLPGYNDLPQPAGSTYFLIGNEKQLTAMDHDLEARGREPLYRLYPRDFWLVAQKNARNSP
jgi:Zn-dependent M16 (insulinase) family peptidase